MRAVAYNIEQNRVHPTKSRKLTIRNFLAAFSYDIFCVLPKTPLRCKTHGFGLQYAAYWLAKPMVLGGKMQGFRL